MIYVICGRFQPFHLNHLSLIKKITESFKKGDELVVIIGSANESRTDRNPFTWKERKEMISSVLKDELKDINYRIEHINDYDNYMDWVEKLKKIVGSDQATICGNEDVDFYARLTGYTPKLIPLKSNIHATQIRALLKKGKFSKHLPKQVINWLKENKGLDIIKEERYFNY